MEFNDFLADKAQLSEDDINKLSIFVNQYGVRPEVAAVNLGIVSEEKIVEIVAAFLNASYLPSDDVTDFLDSIDKSALPELPSELSSLLKDEKHFCLSFDAPELYCLTSQAFSNDIYQYCINHGLVLKQLLCSDAVFREVESLLVLETTNGQLIGDNEVEKLKEIASEAPIVNLVNSLFSRAMQAGASDLHIEPYNGNARVRFRVDGVLKTVEVLPHHIQLPVISRIKILSEMDIAEKRRPQDGKISLRVAGKELDIRVSALPLAEGESIVMRFLVKESVSYDIESIGLSPDIKAFLEEDIQKTAGVVLLTGPTGSGKTTSLYSFLSKLNSDDVKIITLEDPVEYQLEGINQIHVNSDIGYTFAKGLRSIVRQDPDIIMLGEIRDQETANVALQSALTGHLVFSTVHTNDAPSSYTRLLDLGVDEFLLNAALVSIVAQRLARKLCTHCCDDNKDLILSETYGLTEKAKQWGLNTVNLKKAVGCKQCNFTGFKGRLAIVEYLRCDDAISAMPKSDDFIAKAHKKMHREGVRTLMEDGLYKVIQGQTTIEEIQRVCG